MLRYTDNGFSYFNVRVLRLGHKFKFSFHARQKQGLNTIPVEIVNLLEQKDILTIFQSVY